MRRLSGVDIHALFLADIAVHRNTSDGSLGFILDLLLGLGSTVPVAEQELAKADLTRRIAECDKKIAGADHSLDELRDKEMRLQLDISGITQTMNRELSNRRYEIDADLCGCEDELKHLEQTISLKENQIVGNEKAITDADAERKKIGEKYNAEYAKAFDEAPYLFDESKWVFDENSTVCSLCGQKLPEDKIEQLKADFESRKEKAKADAEEKLKAKRFKFDTDKKVELNRLNTIGTEKKELITELTKKNADLNTEIDALKKQEQDAIAKKEELSKQLSEIPSEADYTQNEDYVKLKAERDKVLADIEKLESDGADKIVTDLKVEKADLQSKLDEVNKIIAQAENNVQIDDKIADMQHKQNEYGQRQMPRGFFINSKKFQNERISYLLKKSISISVLYVGSCSISRKTENIRKFVFLRCLMKKLAFTRCSVTRLTLAGKLKRRLIFATVFRSSLICMFRFSLMVQKVSMMNMYRLLIHS